MASSLEWRDDAMMMLLLTWPFDLHYIIAKATKQFTVARLNLHCKWSYTSVHVWMQVMHFLLGRGADVTLCNHSNQTALHVSQPDLQKELLDSLLSPLAHRAQLLEVAWRGDIDALQRLLVSRPVSDSTHHLAGGKHDTRFRSFYLRPGNEAQFRYTKRLKRLALQHWPSALK